MSIKKFAVRTAKTLGVLFLALILTVIWGRNPISQGLVKMLAAPVFLAHYQLQPSSSEYVFFDFNTPAYITPPEIANALSNMPCPKTIIFDSWLDPADPNTHSLVNFIDNECLETHLVIVTVVGDNGKISKDFLHSIDRVTIAHGDLKVDGFGYSASMYAWEVGCQNGKAQLLPSVAIAVGGDIEAIDREIKSFKGADCSLEFWEMQREAPKWGWDTVMPIPIPTDLTKVTENSIVILGSSGGADIHSTPIGKKPGSHLILALISSQKFVFNEFLTIGVFIFSVFVILRNWKNIFWLYPLVSSLVLLFWEFEVYFGLPLNFLAPPLILAALFGILRKIFRQIFRRK